MAVTAEEIAFALELFAPLGSISSRKMMGGLTIYHAGTPFAILSSEGRVYLKAKGAFAAQMAEEGCEKFSMGEGKTMGYWTLPDAALDDPELAAQWGQRALDAL